MSARDSILAGAERYELSPKTMRVKHFRNGTAWTKNQCAIHFYTPKDGQAVFSFDGNAKAAYQLGLNIINDKQAQREIGIEL